MHIVGLPEEFAQMKHRVTVAAYHRMGEAGVLAPDAPTELIEAEILDMAPIGSRHASVVNRLNRLFLAAAGERAIASLLRQPLTRVG